MGFIERLPLFVGFIGVLVENDR